MTSLAIAGSTKHAITAFAGINSSSAELARGVNHHLRSFRLRLPDQSEVGEKDAEIKKTAKGAEPPTPLGKVALFESIGAETYQRVMRMSQPQKNGGRMAAIATGLAPISEIVVFNASNDTPSKADLRLRVRLQKAEEAADLDLRAGNDGKFELVYCTDYDVCMATVSANSKTTNTQPKAVFTTPHIGAPGGKRKRSIFRAVRFLTPTLLVIIANLPGRTGTEVLLLHVPRERSRGGTVLLRKKLPRAVTSATSLATAFLPGANPSQNTQHVLAIAGQDISITILTLDLHPTAQPHNPKFKTFAMLKDVHPVQMTSLAFSHFKPPADPRTASPQYLKLASTSMGATVVVHTIPLRAYPPWSSNSQPVRYVLSSPAGRAEVGQIGISILITIVMAAFGGILIQALTEIRGGSPEYLGAKNWLPGGLRDRFAVPYMFAEAPVIVESMPPLESMRSKASGKVEHARSAASQNAQSAASDISIGVDSASSALSAAGETAASVFPHFETPLPTHVKQAILNWHAPAEKRKLVLLRDTEEGLDAEQHHDEGELAKKGRKWEELSENEKLHWRRKLTRAGEWTESQLETVLKGVFFGELGGVVAGAIRG